ncbi:hypothetical protein GCM10010441_01370 [Kitasatospora paracochleata]
MAQAEPVVDQYVDGGMLFADPVGQAAAPANSEPPEAKATAEADRTAPSCRTGQAPGQGPGGGVAGWWLVSVRAMRRPRDW